ncbi:methyl-accepting chemotaxis protein [Paenibacillus cellulosilyticus]|uniref:Methyl-accepting chemotaxis protein n=1 Tax=Paenibacillus cellulosilyticus TaxID=375489 RepID=A0A2V2YMQ7_9BACL|nr:methyl-accepting chemotaxis protein [Paenibacillus cellulosilyticus]PWV95559.1 methyl-accepting chemotaxis protein [Paenibacillus cellulosilyticus]QKS47363.1 methyl-accepting chemotaxis protein [Paenibacillus cellulosilyticus]
MLISKSIKYKIIWPVIVVVMATIVALSVVVYQLAADSIQEKGRTTAKLAAIGLENALIARETTENVMETEMYGQATLVSYLVEKGLLTYQTAVELSKRSGIDEFWVTDSKGQVTVTNLGQNIDFNFGTDPKAQAYEFMDLINGKRDRVAQPAQVRTVDTKVYKFVGVSGWASKHIVQVGRDGARLMELESTIGAQPLINQIKEGLGDDIVFSAMADQEGKLLYSSEEATTTLNGELLEVAKGLQAKETAYVSSDFHGQRADFYVSSLSDGHYFVMAITTKVLDEIRNLTIGCAVAGLALSIAVVFFIVSRQTRRIKLLQQSMTAISEGDADLTHRLPAGYKDEIGEVSNAANRFFDQIHVIVKDVKRATAASKADTESIKSHSDQTVAISREIRMAVQEMASASATQAQDMEHGVEAVMQLTDAIDETKHNASQLHAYNQTLQEKQEQGNEAVAILSASMQRTVEMSNDVMGSLTQLKSDIDAIGDMAGTIAGISSQTNLLALNASIEASRAGEQGRGFAVVAAEIRKLADQSNVSASRIQELLGAVQHSAQQTVQSMQATTDIVQRQEQAVHVTSSMFLALRETFAKMNGAISQIAASMDQLMASKQTIASFIQTSSAMAEESAASAQEVLASTESQVSLIENVTDLTDRMVQIMNELESIVNRFKV